VTTTPGTVPTGTPGTGPTGTPSGTPTTVPSGSPGATGTPPAAGEISSQRAVEIALASVGGGQLDEVERDREHGRTVWSVEFGKDGGEIEVDVDATTGEVVQTDRDDDDDDDDRDDDEDGDDD
jgi:hypothetical protein